MKIILIIAGLFTIIKIFTEAIGVLPDINLALKSLIKTRAIILISIIAFLIILIVIMFSLPKIKTDTQNAIEQIDTMLEDEDI